MSSISSPLLDFGSKFGQKTFQCTNFESNCWSCNPIHGKIGLDWIGLGWVGFLIDPSRQRNSNIARP